MLTLSSLTPSQVAEAVPDLATILLDCVAGGASVSFMADLTREGAEAFWRGVAEAATEDGRAVLVARDEMGLVGVVEVIPAGPANQPHRADVAKMLVHRRGRRQGIGEALMRAAEDAARDMGKTLLVLDTVTGHAGERLYTRLDWVRVGVIPDFAVFPDGSPCATTIFYKKIAP